MAAASSRSSRRRVSRSMELTLFVEHQCNLRCTYCYTGDKFTRRMSSETIDRKSVV